jgi:hypothetical protein
MARGHNHSAMDANMSCPACQEEERKKATMSDPQRPEREAIERLFEEVLDAWASQQAMSDDAAIESARRRMSALLAALPPTPTPGWQPMDTLPSDYWQERTTLQLVVAVQHDLHSQTFGYWNGRHWQDMESQRIEPIYWLKMPPLPAPTGGRE